MKRQLLLCLMVFGLFCAAQSSLKPLAPRILEDSIRLMPTSHPIEFKSFFYDPTDHNQVAKSSKINAEQATYQVDFVLDFDESSFESPDQIRLINKENDITNWTLGVYQLVNGSNVLSVPGGVYDIIVSFYSYNDNLIVIREQVEINDNMQMSFAASEAKNHIRFQTLTKDGEPVFTGIAGFDENWQIVPLQPGNTDEVFSQQKIYCTDYGVAFEVSGHFGMVITDEENIDPLTLYTHADIFVNDVSDRYTFYCYRVAMNGRDMYTSTYEVAGAQGDVIIANDPSKYQLFFEDPCMAQKQPDADLCQSFEFFAKNEKLAGYYYSFVTIESPLLEPGETCRYYISAQDDDSKVGYIPFIQPQNAVRTVTHQPWGDQETYTWNLISMPLVKTMDQIVFANNGPGSYSYNQPNFDIKEIDEDGNYVNYFSWPSHPVFTYPVDKKIGDLGNNCPVLVSLLGQDYTIVYYNENGEAQIMPLLFNTFDYIGRYGEKQLIVTQNTTADYKVNGRDFVSITGPNSVVLDEPINGVVDATIVNDAVDVDGLAGSNKAQAHYTAGARDATPPTMTMLHFRDVNDNVTDRFATSDEGILEFTAGDFNMLFSPQNLLYYDRQMPETIEVSYSPYGEDNWNELPVEEVPENYWPTMGWFYTGSLAGVTGQAEKGWFDLKIRLEDAAGNWQEQVLSPAFRIDNLAYTSVANIGSDNAHEVARYSLDGKRVDASHRGVTIVKMSDGTARKVLVK